MRSSPTLQHDTLPFTMGGCLGRATGAPKVQFFGVIFDVTDYMPLIGSHLAPDVPVDLFDDEDKGTTRVGDTEHDSGWDVTANRSAQDHERPAVLYQHYQPMYNAQMEQWNARARTMREDHDMETVSSFVGLEYEEDFDREEKLSSEADPYCEVIMPEDDRDAAEIYDSVEEFMQELDSDAADADHNPAPVVEIRLEEDNKAFESVSDRIFPEDFNPWTVIDLKDEP
jgi:hypothetical protein